MKLSELKSIIVECIDELNEGPARDYRKKTGIRHSQIGFDHLANREHIKKTRNPSNADLKHHIGSNLYDRLTQLGKGEHYTDKIAVGGTKKKNLSRQNDMEDAGTDYKKTTGSFFKHAREDDQMRTTKILKDRQARRRLT